MRKYVYPLDVVVPTCGKCNACAKMEEYTTGNFLVWCSPSSVCTPHPNCPELAKQQIMEDSNPDVAVRMQTDARGNRTIWCGEPQGAKADAGKPRLSIVPYEALARRVAVVREYGNRKYGDSENWKTVEPSRYKDAMLRHLFAWLADGDSLDGESGLPHFDHFLCNAVFLAEFEERRKEHEDDIGVAPDAG